MIGIEQILQQYRQTDQEGRLALYLSYRELRGRFDEIDRAYPTICALEPGSRARLPRKWIVNWMRTRLTITLEGR